jgi:hypothetical protein
MRYVYARTGEGSNGNGIRIDGLGKRTYSTYIIYKPIGVK